MSTTNSKRSFIFFCCVCIYDSTAGHVDAGSHGNRQAGNVVDKLILPGDLRYVTSYVAYFDFNMLLLW